LRMAWCDNLGGLSTPLNSTGQGVRVSTSLGRRARSSLSALDACGCSALGDAAEVTPTLGTAAMLAVGLARGISWLGTPRAGRVAFSVSWA